MPTTDVDIANRALSEIGARCDLTVIDDTTPQGRVVGTWINVVRRELLRAAPWQWSRKTAALTSLGVFTDDPNIVPIPWNAMYEYPADAVKINYILPPPPTVSLSVPAVGVPSPWWGGPSRTNRFIPSYYDPGGMEEPQIVLLANILDALAVYVVDVTDPELMDVGFKEGWVALLASKLVQPLTGNVQMKAQYEQLAKMHVDAARAQNANEAITTSDHTVDWIATREVGGYYGFAGPNGTSWLNGPGQWYDGWDSYGWSM